MYLCPAHLGDFLVYQEMIRDLVDLKVDQGGIFIATCVILDQNRTGFFNSSLADEPAWRFWIEEKAHKLNDGYKALEQRRNSPCPAGRHGERSKGCPAGKNCSDEEEGVIKTGDLCAMSRICQFCNEDRRRNGTEFQANSDEESADCKHCNILRSGLENGRCDEDQVAELDTSTATDAVGEPSSRATKQDLSMQLANERLGIQRAVTLTGPRFRTPLIIPSVAALGLLK